MFSNKKLAFHFLNFKQKVENLLLQNIFLKLCNLKRVRAKEMAIVITVQILSDVPGVKTVQELINSLIPLIKALEGLAAVFT